MKFYSNKLDAISTNAQQMRFTLMFVVKFRIPVKIYENRLKIVHLTSLYLLLITYSPAREDNSRYKRYVKYKYKLYKFDKNNQF